MRRRARRAARGAAVLMVAAASLATAHAQVGQVNGTVIGRSARPVTGAAVALIPAETPAIYGTSTAEDGRYAFSGLPTDVYSVVVIPPRGGRARKDGIRVRALFRSIVDFDFAQPAGAAPLPSPPAAGDGAAGEASVLTCAIHNATRQPVPDALVQVFPVGREGGARRVRTDAEGGCRIEGIAPGTYRILVVAPGFVTWILEPVPLDGAGDRTLHVTLQPFPMGFDGTLIDLLVPMEPIPPPGP